MTTKTNREVHEEAAGMGLCPEFFAFNSIDPDAPAEPCAFCGKSEECDCPHRDKL